MYSYDNIEDIHAHEILHQWVEKVIDFSSSYGADNSISYSAINICNRPSKWPAYGDFAETYHMLNYGPSTLIEYSMKDQEKIITFHDFVIIKFEQFVVPRQITIYETYNPGSIVRILAFCNTDQVWKILYENPPQIVEKKSREFSPKLKEMITPTRIVRLEFNHSLIEYYTGIDAVLLSGIKCSRSNRSPQKIRPYKGIIQQRLETVDFKPQISPSAAIEEFLRNDLNKFIEKVGLSTSPNEKSIRRSREKTIKEVPYEVLFKIFSYLDLKSLYRVSQVCKTFHNIVVDPLLYQEINLKFYWHLANSSLMESLKQRCKLIRKLDMSSCGYFESIESRDFLEFIELNGKFISHLRLNSSQFLNTSCLDAICRTCKNLTELSIRNYVNVTNERDFSSLMLLETLVELDVSRSGIDSGTLLGVLRNNKNLQILKMEFASPHIILDDVCMVVSVFNPKIKVLNAWKSYSLSNRGMRALSECLMLEEINLGWTLRFDQESTLTDSLKLILKNCRHLRFLCLSAVRGITERDLENISNLGENLEHLDLMGIVGVSSQMISRILSCCTKLKLLDISFCENIDEMSIIRWRQEFEHCIIQRSDMPNA